MERQIGAIENLLTELRLLRSCFSEEQLKKPVLEETLPNLMIVFEAPSETQTLAMQEGLQTPCVTSQRLSVGMTPKTLRLPKPGEMLLSVHGSPLGVF